VPASFCGVVGLMPTHGAITTEGVFPLAWSLDRVGLLTRSVADCATLFAAVHDTAPAPQARPVIGVPNRYYGEHAAPEVLAAWRNAALALEAAGHRVIEVDVMETAEIRTLTRLIMRTEAASAHRQAMQSAPENYPLAVRKFITGGEGLLAVDYVDALRLRAVLLRRALAENFAQADVLLTPCCPLLPPRYDAIADAADASVWRVVATLAHCTQPASYLGLPALAVPFSLSAAGLPIGVQLISRPRTEATLFAAAETLQHSWQSLAAWPTHAA
jgi:aspartyl-tRNA(Asn)/glutamyl-tRNA(Gln) amidotransferase subunit A